jgi:hypothetical protein
MAQKKNSLASFKAALKTTAERLAESAANIVEEEGRKHFVHGLKVVEGMGELRDAGYPLSTSGFDPDGAGLTQEWDILIQSGTLQASWGQDPVRSALAGVSVNVGFDDSGPSGPRGYPWGHYYPGAHWRSDTIDMFRLLTYLLGGTALMVGRPMLHNTFAEAHPKLQDLMKRRGLKNRLSSDEPKIMPVIT